MEEGVGGIRGGGPAGAALDGKGGGGPVGASISGIRGAGALGGRGRGRTWCRGGRDWRWGQWRRTLSWSCGQGCGRGNAAKSGRGITLGVATRPTHRQKDRVGAILRVLLDGQIVGIVHSDGQAVCHHVGGSKEHPEYATCKGLRVK